MYLHMQIMRVGYNGLGGKSSYLKTSAPKYTAPYQPKLRFVPRKKCKWQTDTATMFMCVTEQLFPDFIVHAQIEFYDCFDSYYSQAH